jgi:hypothetical protein
MSLSNLTTKQFSEIKAMLAKKEALSEQLDAINKALDAIETGNAVKVNIRSVAVGRPAKAAKVAKVGKSERAARGSVKQDVMEAIQKAGENGIQLKDIAKNCGRASTQVNVCVTNLSKQYKEIKRLGRGCYAWIEKASKAK